MLSRRWTVPLALLLAALLAGTAAFAYWPRGEDPDEATTPAALADLPDVVAEVDGQEIAKEDFLEIYRAQRQAAQQQPEESRPDEQQLRRQVAQAMVTEALLRQEAERRGISPTKRQVRRALTEVAQQSGMSVDQLVSALEEQGLSRADIDEKAAGQAQLDLLVADEAGEITVSNRELRDLYESLEQQAADEEGDPLPALAEVRDELRAQVEARKESQVARELIDRLRADADISLFL